MTREDLEQALDDFQSECSKGNEMDNRTAIARERARIIALVESALGETLS